MKSEKIATLRNELSKNWNLRKAESAWAGGDNIFNVVVDEKEVSLTADSNRVWSKNGKWSGNDMYVSLHAPEKMLKNLVIVQIHGVLSFFEKNKQKKNSKAFPCYWVEQSRGFSVKLIAGFCVRGQHIIAPDLKTAIKKVATQREKTAKALIASRNAKRIEKIKLCGTWVTIDDSLKAGNCLPGTQNFFNRVIVPAFGQAGAVRADALLELAQKDGREVARVQRAIAMAQAVAK